MDSHGWVSESGNVSEAQILKAANKIRMCCAPHTAKAQRKVTCPTNYFCIEMIF